MVHGLRKGRVDRLSSLVDARRDWDQAQLHPAALVDLREMVHTACRGASTIMLGSAPGCPRSARCRILRQSRQSSPRPLRRGRHNRKRRDYISRCTELSAIQLCSLTSLSTPGGKDSATDWIMGRDAPKLGLHGRAEARNHERSNLGTRDMYNRYQWSPESHVRNRTTMRYEPVQPFLFVEFSKRISTEVVFDIGANIGQYSIFSNEIESVRQVFAFEAEEAAFAALSKNVDLNGLSNKIIPNFKAVSNQPGEVSFGVARPLGGNNAIINTSIHRVSKYVETRVVPSIKLDDFYSGKGNKISLKIDVEGHELEVLEGASTTLAGNEGLIQVEIYKNLEVMGAKLAELGYAKLLAVGSDYYYSNSKVFGDPATVLSAVESAMSEIVRYNLKG